MHVTRVTVIVFMVVALMIVVVAVFVVAVLVAHAHYSDGSFA